MYAVFRIAESTLNMFLKVTIFLFILYSHPKLLLCRRSTFPCDKGDNHSSLELTDWKQNASKNSENIKIRQFWMHYTLVQNCWMFRVPRFKLDYLFYFFRQIIEAWIATSAKHNCINLNSFSIIQHNWIFLYLFYCSSFWNYFILKYIL